MIDVIDVQALFLTDLRKKRHHGIFIPVLSRSRRRCVAKTAPFLQSGSAVTAPGSYPGDAGSIPASATNPDRLFLGGMTCLLLAAMVFVLYALIGAQMAMSFD